MTTPILKEIYFNPKGEKDGNIFFMTDDEIRKHIFKFNSRYNTNYDPEKMIDAVKYIKTYPGKLYKTEYSRVGEVEYLNDFCDVDNFYNYQKKNNTFRLVSFNIHSFIESCKNFKRDENGIFVEINDKSNINFNSRDNVLDMFRQLNPDILALQEYSPSVVDGKIELEGFKTDYIRNVDSAMKNLSIYSGHIGLSKTYEPTKKDTFLGNLILTRYDILKRYNLSTPNKVNTDPRPFLITLLDVSGEKVLVVNIHPVAEYGDEAKEKSENFKQIKTVIDLISTKYNTTSDCIIVCGDFNNHHKYLIEYMQSKLFIQSNSLYEPIGLQYTGYHGSYLDHIFISLGFLKKFSIVDHSVVKVNFSDHYPVFLDFRKRDENYMESLEETVSRYNYSIRAVMNYDYINELRFSTGKFNNSELVIKKDILKLLDEKMNTLINLDSVQQIISKRVVTIPEGIYLGHGTDFILPSGKYDGFFELSLNEQDFKSKPEVPLSFTMLNLPNESFMSWYGVDTEISFKRLLVYKTTKTVKLVNLYDCGETLNERVSCRLRDYLKLYTEYAKVIGLPEISSKGFEESPIGFDVMRVLWIIMNHQILLHINKVDDRYNPNMVYGFVLADTIANDFALFKKNINHSNTVPYWRTNELYEGVEIQMFAHHFCTEFAGVFYNTRFYNPQEWKDEYSKIFDSTTIERKRLKISKPLSFRSSPQPSNKQKNKIIKRNIIAFMSFIIEYIESPYYSQEIEKKSGQVLKQIFNHNDDRIKFKEPYTINVLLNDFLLCIINAKYFYCMLSTCSNLKIIPTDFTKDNVYEYSNGYEEVYKSFMYYLIKKSKALQPSTMYNLQKKVIKQVILFICNIHKSRISNEPIKLINIMEKSSNSEFKNAEKCISDILENKIDEDQKKKEDDKKLANDAIEVPNAPTIIDRGLNDDEIEKVDDFRGFYN